MPSQPGLQTVAIHILPNISRSKGNQTVKLGQLIWYNKRIISKTKTSELLLIKYIKITKLLVIESHHQICKKNKIKNKKLYIPDDVILSPKAS